jgi:hypothetical protein
MSAATIETTIITTPREHLTYVGDSPFVCVQPHCDGVHHYYVSCRAH